MSLVGLVIILILVGVGLYFVGMIPMDKTLLQIIRVVVILVVVLWLVSALGLLDIGPHIKLR